MQREKPYNETTKDVNPSNALYQLCVNLLVFNLLPVFPCRERPY